uniref:Uncharacterized protein n=1 Tax=Tanacetum cinerariifolium TaxID=118510 RepID=A0A6L2LBK5_TANCI|nr:hypothetical protein [Tanacetum cinerariifolium]
MRIDQTKTLKEPTYQVVLDALALTTCYPAFLIIEKVLKIYMHQFWHTITKIKNSSSHKFNLDKRKCTIDVELFRYILQIYPIRSNQEFVLLSRNLVSKTKEYQVYGALIPAGMTNRKMRNSTTTYKTYLAFSTGEATPKKARKFKKLASPSKKKTLVTVEEPVENLAKKPAARRQSAGVQIRDTHVALLEKAQLKKAIKRSKRETNIHQESGSSEGADLELEVPNEPKGKTINTSEGTGLKPRVPVVSKSDSSEKLRDIEPADEGKYDEEMTHADHVDVGHENVNQEIVGEQVKDVSHAIVIVSPATQKTRVPLQSSFISSDYGTKFLKLDNIPSADTEIILVMDIKFQHKDPTIRVAIKSEVPTVVKEYLETSLDNTLHKVIKRHIAELIKEHFVLADVIEKRTLFETMTKTKSFNKNTKHKALYHALMESILEDEDAMDKGVVDKSKKRKPDDADRDEGLPAGSNQGLKKKKTSKDTKPSKKAKSFETSKGTTKSQPNLLTSLHKQMRQCLRLEILKILVVTNVKVNIWHGYGHLEETKVQRSDQQLYKFMKGNFPRLHLNDIKDMLILVVQNRLFNLKGEDIVHLAATLQRNRQMCSHELNKFSDGTLISVQDKLKDMFNNLEMGNTSVMPRRRWDNLDKK